MMNAVNQRTRIKMCGMTTVNDVLSAAKAGADAVGLVFYPPSPRNVTLQEAVRLSEQVPCFVDCVALVVNPSVALVNDILKQVKPTFLQFHGDESAEFCRQFNHRYIKAIRVKSAEQLARDLTEHENADAILLDAHVEGVPGGTGQAFDWAMIPKTMRSKIILAGGLTPENIQSAVEAIRPFAVDVSGGIERSKGVKEASKMVAFSAGVYRADLAANG